ncbi:hypothetical protein HZF05_09265 [Sphingomonas sp. CGMCC 1.13654]|uniref:Uncharacterized protein n=1 Tax=Sphingomonas chungangi TaxID=2683589 RepID=A0A838L9V3_9SPHN|nr:hypothetical protein [Sphingomonas chungangi]MBA2934288.1 hypothetical protein [Sphingomonas chungangi]MVW57329.1 hypothetical protein [Sphingomonas chungangi]
MSMTATNMTDRIARAIHTALPGASGGNGPPDWDDLGEDARAGYRLAAHRAIGAMRIPTDEMLHEGDRRDLARDAANVWERMVFTALTVPG